MLSLSCDLRLHDMTHGHINDITDMMCGHMTHGHVMGHVITRD